MDDNQHEKRGASRVECDLPVRVRHGAQREFEARLTDLSRLGVCVRVPGDVLGVHRLSSLVQVARQVAAVLGPRFDVWLGGEGGVSRTLEPVRICQRNWESRDVELGCALSRPLSDADLDLLQLQAPPLRDGTIVPTEPEPATTTWQASGGTAVRAVQEGEFVPLGAIGESAPHHVGYIAAEAEHRGRPIQGRTQFVTSQEAVLVVPAYERTPFANLDIAALILQFAETYGERPSLRILRGPRALWSGTVRLTEVETPASRMGPMRLRVQFEDPLTANERQILGVVA